MYTIKATLSWLNFADLFTSIREAQEFLASEQATEKDRLEFKANAAWVLAMYGLILWAIGTVTGIALLFCVGQVSGLVTIGITGILGGWMAVRGLCGMVAASNQMARINR